MWGDVKINLVLVLCEMQSVSSRIWTRVAVSISYDDNHGLWLSVMPSPLLIQAEKALCRYL